MTIKEMVDYFIREYSFALRTDWVQKPISYALYHTWKWVDEKERPKVREESE